MRIFRNAATHYEMLCFSRIFDRTAVEPILALCVPNGESEFLDTTVFAKNDISVLAYEKKFTVTIADACENGVYPVNERNRHELGGMLACESIGFASRSILLNQPHNSGNQEVAALVLTSAQDQLTLMSSSHPG